MKKNALYLLILPILVISCSSDKQRHKELAYIDIKSDYPEKEMNLTDIADVTYIHLNAKNDDFLYKGRIDYVTQNTIIVVDRSTQSVLFFSKDGNPKSRFNRKGQGPEEYTDAAYVMYDETTDEVFISPDFSDHIKVYSSSGEFKRKLTFPQININGQMVLFDDQSIMVYDNTNLWQNIREKCSGEKMVLAKQYVDSSFYLISKSDGKVLEYISLSNKNIDLSYCDPEGSFFGQINYARVRKSPDGLFLYNPENDTIFLYGKDRNLTPYMHKKPLLSDLNPITTMDICMDAGKFLFMSVYPYSADGNTPEAKYFMRDKKTGEIFRQKFTLFDYKGKDFNINPRLPNYYDNGYHFELDLFELKEAHRENKLSGKLKELVTSLNEEVDNNIFVFLSFK